MSRGKKPPFRVDWFDGSLLESAKPSSSQLADEDTEPKTDDTPAEIERKPVGFIRLRDISLLQRPLLTLEVSNRPGFWLLFDQDELQGDFIVLIVRILAEVSKDIKPGDKSKIANMFETRLLSTNFLKKLTTYIHGLPKVRIVQKRRNSLLWDDIQDFFNKVLDLCDCLISVYIGGKQSDKLKNRILRLLRAVCESAIGVSEAHLEQFSDEMFDRSATLQSKVEMDISENETKNYDPDSFKNLNIFPTKNDLVPHSISGLRNKGKSLDEENNAVVQIKPNIINGAYPSVEHYLDTQFKLFREDYFGPLREGICKYLKNPDKKRHENIRVFPAVRIIRTYVSNNKVGHLVDLAWHERANNRPLKKTYIKKLMFGSLLLFTNDNFHTILCATAVQESTLLQHGYIVVAFQNPVSKNILSEPYLMVESEVFFEPYHRVLKVLQDSKVDSLPMEEYIVDVKPETKPPSYLTPDTVYSIEASDKSEISVTVLDTDRWPSDRLNLDESQLDAFKFALTREFAVIQGPPGTGKTFLGVKIASTLLKNLSLEGTPMLVICYTNHALDQFLEGILEVTDSIVRIGQQSKSRKLQPYNLNVVRSKVKCKYSYLYMAKKSELELIYNKLTDLQTEIEKCEQGIICYKHVKLHLKIDEQEFELKHSTEDRVLNWLFEHLDSSKSQEVEIEEDSWESFEDLEISDGKIETCFSENSALSHVESLRNIIKHVDDNKESFKNPEAAEKVESEVRKIMNRLESFKSNMALYSGNKGPYDIDKVNDLFNLKTEQRWKMYFNAVRDIKIELLNKMDVLLHKHNTVSSELREVSTHIDGEVIRTSRVVGVTTTAAATRHQLLTVMSSPIVIVEEAAEVLEAHIIASLTPKCQHLILIGDHKQLRPTAANYQLSLHHNIEISLFERMIRNGIHARTLQTQRRMRPEFVQLLVPEIYDRLDSHCSVLRYPDVRGVENNLYFISHTQLEDNEGMEDSWSHKNKFEAESCVTLARHLRRMKYSSQDITILATYLGQVHLIGEFARKFKELNCIKITTVDNFQGEESRIVILSLVRSNREGRIGFLSAPNRICVALSRAKEGFYIFGNMSMLKAASPIWSTICDKLTARDAIGDKLPLMH